MSKVANDQSFTVTVVGDRTKTTYTGTFTARVILSYSQEIARDRLFREALGDFPQHASPRVRDLAEILADCDVSFTKVPPFWVGAENGRNLMGDDNVLSEVYSKLQKLRKEASGTEEEATVDKAKIEKALGEE